MSVLAGSKEYLNEESDSLALEFVATAHNSTQEVRNRLKVSRGLVAVLSEASWRQAQSQKAETGTIFEGSTVVMVGVRLRGPRFVGEVAGC